MIDAMQFTGVDTSLPQLETVDVFTFTPADAPSDEPIAEEPIVLLPPELIEMPVSEPIMAWQIGGPEGSMILASDYQYYADLWGADIMAQLADQMQLIQIG